MQHAVAVRSAIRRLKEIVTMTGSSRKAYKLLRDFISFPFTQKWESNNSIETEGPSKEHEKEEEEKEDYRLIRQEKEIKFLCD